MVGLVASATHLGNPANALYVFLGVGRSPLSTEVFCAVVFLALGGGVLALLVRGAPASSACSAPGWWLAHGGQRHRVRHVRGLRLQRPRPSYRGTRWYVPAEPVAERVGGRPGPCARWACDCRALGAGSAACFGRAARGDCRSAALAAEPRVGYGLQSARPAGSSRTRSSRPPTSCRITACIDRRVRRAWRLAGIGLDASGPARPHAGGRPSAGRRARGLRRARSCWPASSSCASRST